MSITERASSGYDIACLFPGFQQVVGLSSFGKNYVKSFPKFFISYVASLATRELLGTSTVDEVWRNIIEKINTVRIERNEITRIDDRLVHIIPNNVGIDTQGVKYKGGDEVPLDVWDIFQMSFDQSILVERKFIPRWALAQDNPAKLTPLEREFIDLRIAKYNADKNIKKCARNMRLGLVRATPVIASLYSTYILATDY